jgi:hypothetical protein
VHRVGREVSHHGQDARVRVSVTGGALAFTCSQADLRGAHTRPRMYLYGTSFL